MTMQIADRIQITGSGASTALAANEGSLAELVGFNSKVQRLGKLRDEKEIKEAYRITNPDDYIFELPEGTGRSGFLKKKKTNK